MTDHPLPPFDSALDHTVPASPALAAGRRAALEWGESANRGIFCGRRRMGKTSLLRLLAARLSRAERTTPVRAKPTAKPGFAALVSCAGESLGESGAFAEDVRRVVEVDGTRGWGRVWADGAAGAWVVLDHTFDALAAWVSSVASGHTLLVDEPWACGAELLRWAANLAGRAGEPGAPFQRVLIFEHPEVIFQYPLLTTRGSHDADHLTLHRLFPLGPLDPAETGDVLRLRGLHGMDRAVHWFTGGHVGRITDIAQRFYVEDTAGSGLPTRNGAAPLVAIWRRLRRVAAERAEEIELEEAELLGLWRRHERDGRHDDAANARAQADALRHESARIRTDSCVDAALDAWMAEHLPGRSLIEPLSAVDRRLLARELAMLLLKARVPDDPARDLALGVVPEFYRPDDDFLLTRAQGARDIMAQLVAGPLPRTFNFASDDGWTAQQLVTFGYLSTAGDPTASERPVNVVDLVTQLRCGHLERLGQDIGTPKALVIQATSPVVDLPPEDAGEITAVAVDLTRGAVRLSFARWGDIEVTRRPNAELVAMACITGLVSVHEQAINAARVSWARRHGTMLGGEGIVDYKSRLRTCLRDALRARLPKANIDENLKRVFPRGVDRHHILRAPTIQLTPEPLLAPQWRLGGPGSSAVSASPAALAHAWQDFLRGALNLVDSRMTAMDYWCREGNGAAVVVDAGEVFLALPRDVYSHTWESARVRRAAGAVRDDNDDATVWSPGIPLVDRDDPLDILRALWPGETDEGAFWLVD